MTGSKAFTRTNTINFIALLLSLFLVPLNPALAYQPAESTVEAFVHDYFATFTAKPLASNPEQRFTFPAVFINDGKVRLIPDASVKVFDYEVINATGWAYSKIIETTVLYEGPNSAVVQVDFNRHKADDTLLSTSKVFYTLALTEAGWKLVGSYIPGGITLVG